MYSPQMKFKGHLVHLKDKARNSEEENKKKPFPEHQLETVRKGKQTKKPFPEHQTPPILAEHPARILLCPPFKLKLGSKAIHRKTHL